MVETNAYSQKRRCAVAVYHVGGVRLLPKNARRTVWQMGSWPFVRATLLRFPMKDKSSIIEAALAEYRPSDGALIAFINGRLVDAGLHQLNCAERRDVLETHARACTVDSQ